MRPIVLDFGFDSVDQELKAPSKFAHPGRGNTVGDDRHVIPEVLRAANFQRLYAAAARRTCHKATPLSIAPSTNNGKSRSGNGRRGKSGPVNR